MPKLTLSAMVGATLLSSYASFALATPFEETLAELKSNPEHWQQVAHDYAPLIYLHPTEQFMPGDAEQFQYNAQDIDNHLTYPLGSTQPYGAPAELRGVNPQHAPAPVYVTIVPKKHAKDKIVDITYWTFYPYNEGKKIDEWFWAYDKAYYGDHVGDWEHATVRFTNGVANKAYLSQHSGGDEFDLPKSSELKDGTRMTIFSAKGAHGLYRQGHDVRYACFPSCETPKNFRVDLVDRMGKGALWDTQKDQQLQVALPTAYENNKLSWDEAWLNYPGQWGNTEDSCIDNLYYVSGEKICKLNGGPSGPNRKSTINPDELDMT